MRIPALSLFILLLTLLVLPGCTRPPLKQVSPPLFTDNGSRTALLTAARRHLAYLQHLPEDHKTHINDLTLSKKQLVDSARLFINIVEKTPEPLEINSQIHKHFMVFQASGRKRDWFGNLLATGYYEPVVPGSLTPEAPYNYPLYRKPMQLLTRSAQLPDGSEIKEVGMLDSRGQLVKFWTRSEIESGNLLAGQELVYLSNPFDAFLLHVQGSGRIQLPDGSTKSVRFAGHNGREYRSIGKLLVDEGILTLQSASVPTIRKYLRENPGELTRVLHHNPRYIFFSWGDDLPPRGSTGIPLTAGRSIAIDRELLPEELIGYLVTESPLIDEDETVLGWREMRRFVLPQDSGAAIKGPGRVDLFWGHDTYSKLAAGVMKQKANLYFLLAKE